MQGLLKNSLLAILTFGGGIALFIVLLLIHLNQGNVDIAPSLVWEAIFSPQDTLNHHTVRVLRLPRAVIGFLSGGALAVAGVILQTVTKNPLSSASTLGIHSGTYFAVVISTIFSPVNLFGSGVVVAFIGGIITFVIVYTLSGGSKATPVKMVLAGMIVTFLFSSLTSLLQIFFENETAGLFLWGGGTLVQNDWSGVKFAFPIIFVGLLILLLLSTKLDSLRLGDEVATSLGQNVGTIKVITIVLAVLLTSVTVSVVGPIGFVGLVAPHIIKLIGYRKHFPLMIGSFIWGGNVLLFADVLSRIIDPSFKELPVGSITALIGAPWLVWLVLRMNQMSYGNDNTSVMAGTKFKSFSLKTVAPISITIILVTLFISISTGNYGFEPLLTIQAITGNADSLMSGFIFDSRMPRALVALLSGALLAVSGLIFQGVLRNPLADPSVIGITSGASVGALLTMYMFQVSAVWIPLGAMVGALVFFMIVMVLAIKAQFRPTILALLGIGMSAFGSAITQILVVKADLGVASALTWLSGTTYAKGWEELTQFLLWPLLLLLPILAMKMRTLDTLSLGGEVATGLGVKVTSARFQFALIATLLAAFAVAAVGAIGFIGLIAPHVSRLIVGPENKKLLPTSMLVGGILLVVADLFSRTMLAPKEIPSGILVAIIGAPYFLWLMKRS
ncbi:iron ABC transporter permease [Aquibacillus sediminis]|uniref:iron ABC transporter permease n=1 Tax=Aquibacillus sediminis TaxID=2574734 RepID=UPI001109457A|nr:iron ABC transporter permease [Aquibacillus sediminis]